MTIFVPNSEEDISKIIKNASQSLTVLGGGTRGFVEPCDNVLKTNGLSGIIDYQPGALTMIAKAGTPLDEINSQLAKQGQKLPLSLPTIEPCSASGSLDNWRCICGQYKWTKTHSSGRCAGLPAWGPICRWARRNP